MIICLQLIIEREFESVYSQNADLSFLKNNDFNGILDPLVNSNSHVSIRVSDWNNNSSYLNFRIKGTIRNDEITSYDGIEILTNQNYEINKNSSVIEIKSNTFYNDLLLNISYRNDTLDLGEDKDPFRKSIIIKLPQAILDTLELRQSFIGRVEDKKITYINSRKDDSYIYINTSSLGKYTYQEIQLNQKLNQSILSRIQMFQIDQQ